MAVDKNTRKSTSAPHKGGPSDTGHSKAEVKQVNKSKTDLQENEEMKEKYVNDADQPADHLVENPNRNPDKAEIHRGKYN